MGIKQSTQVHTVPDEVKESFNLFIERYCLLAEGHYTRYEDLLTSYSIYNFCWNIPLWNEMLTAFYTKYPGVDRPKVVNDQVYYPLWLIKGVFEHHFFLLMQQCEFDLIENGVSLLVIGIKLEEWPSMSNVTIKTDHIFTRKCTTYLIV